MSKLFILIWILLVNVSCTTQIKTSPRLDVFQDKEGKLIIEFSSNTDTTFYLDYKVFSKSCYSNEDDLYDLKSQDDFSEKLRYSQFLIETEGNHFIPYSVLETCSSDHFEIDDCMFDWLRPVFLNSNVQFADTIDLKCDDELISFSSKIRFHYFLRSGKTFDDKIYKEILISSDWKEF